MSRRPVNPSRRFGDNGAGLFSSSKSKSSPILSIVLIVVGVLLFIAYSYRGTGGLGNNLESVSRVEGKFRSNYMLQFATEFLYSSRPDFPPEVI